MNETGARRDALAGVEARLARLRAQYDVLMNAFKFDAARALAGAIEEAERERSALAAALPPVPAEEPKPYSVARPIKRRR